MSLDNLTLRTKALIPVALMGLVVLAVIAFGGFKLAGVSATAGDIIARRTLGTLELSHARDDLMEAMYDVFGVVAFDSDRPQGKAAAAGFPAAIDAANGHFDEAIKLLPEKAAQIGKFKERFQAIADEARRPFDAGQKTRSLLTGSDLKPDELDALAESAMHLTAVDPEMRSLADDLKAFNSSLHDEDAQSALGLRSQALGALWMLGLVGLVATALVSAAAIWISSAAIARPLALLGVAMTALAAGDASVIIKGQRRRDELGAMSRAVEVFKCNALDRMRLETEAAAERARAEAERERNAGERASAAEEQTEAVRSLGAGLKELAAGDLTVKLSDGFASCYAQMRDDFNEAIDKLKLTITTVIGSSGAIESSAKEVKRAAEDLSQRAARQASSNRSRRRNIAPSLPPPGCRAGSGDYRKYPKLG